VSQNIKGGKRQDKYEKAKRIISHQKVTNQFKKDNKLFRTKKIKKQTTAQGKKKKKKNKESKWPPK
jgi:hypothetical protein